MTFRQMLKRPMTCDRCQSPSTHRLLRDHVTKLQKTIRTNKHRSAMRKPDDLVAQIRDSLVEGGLMVWLVLIGIVWMQAVRHVSADEE